MSIPFCDIAEDAQRDIIRLGAKSQARRILTRVTSYGIDVTPLETQPESITLRDLENALYEAALKMHGLLLD